MCIIPRNLIKINSVLFLTEKQQKQAEIQNKTLWSLCHTERFPKSGILIYNFEVQEKCFRQRRMRKKGNSKSYGLQTNALNETILARIHEPENNKWWNDKCLYIYFNSSKKHHFPINISSLLKFSMSKNVSKIFYCYINVWRWFTQKALKLLELKWIFDGLQLLRTCESNRSSYLKGIKYGLL